MKKIIETPEFKARLSVQGFNAEWQEPETFAGLMKNEVQKWGAIVKSANVKVE